MDFRVDNNGMFSVVTACLKKNVIVEEPVVPAAADAAAASAMPTAEGEEAAAPAPPPPAVKTRVKKEKIDLVVRPATGFPPFGLGPAALEESKAAELVMVRRFFRHPILDLAYQARS